MDLDGTLLHITAIFSFLYMFFSIISGMLSDHDDNFSNAVNAANGVVSIVQICMQISFIHNLKNKVGQTGMGGKQARFAGQNISSNFGLRFTITSLNYSQTCL